MNTYVVVDIRTIFCCQYLLSRCRWSTPNCLGTDNAGILCIGPQPSDSDGDLRGRDVPCLRGEDGGEGDEVVTKDAILLICFRWTPGKGDASRIRRTGHKVSRRTRWNYKMIIIGGIIAKYLS